MAIQGRNAQHIGLAAVGVHRDYVAILRASVNVSKVTPYDPERYPLLSSVDEYGDTDFGQDELSALRDEWERLREFATTEQNSAIDKALAATEVVVTLGGNHVLRFEGD